MPADRSVETMRAEITKVQADHDRMDERLGALEASEQRRDEAEAPPSSTASSPKLPRGPGGTRREPRHAPSPDRGRERRTIGPEPRAPPGRGERSPGGPPAGAAEGKARETTTGLSPEAKRDYDAALALVRAKQYDKRARRVHRRSSSTTPITPTPTTPCTGGANASTPRASSRSAAEQFEGLSRAFPYGNKAPDALLKLGLSDSASAHAKRHRRTFAELRDRYPEERSRAANPPPLKDNHEIQVVAPILRFAGSPRGSSGIASIAQASLRAEPRPAGSSRRRSPAPARRRGTLRRQQPCVGRQPPGPRKATAPAPVSPGAIYVRPAANAGRRPAATTRTSHLPSSSQPSCDMSRSQDGFDLGAERGRAEHHARQRQRQLRDLVRTRCRRRGGVPPGSRGEARRHAVGASAIATSATRGIGPVSGATTPSCKTRIGFIRAIRFACRPTCRGPTAELAPRRGGPNGRSGTLRRDDSRRCRRTRSFLRDQGYIDDEREGRVGRNLGKPRRSMLLSEGDNTYLEITPEHDVEPGQELTVFRPLVRNDSRATQGDAWSPILGTAVVEKWDPQTRIARAQAHRVARCHRARRQGGSGDPALRSRSSGPQRERAMGVTSSRRFIRTCSTGRTRSSSSTRDKRTGSVPGNRLFVVARGDEYRKTLKGASKFGTADVHYETEKPPIIETDERARPGRRREVSRRSRRRDPRAQRCAITPPRAWW